MLGLLWLVLTAQLITSKTVDKFPETELAEYHTVSSPYPKPGKSVAKATATETALKFLSVNKKMVTVVTSTGNTAFILLGSAKPIVAIESENTHEGHSYGTNPERETTQVSTKFTTALTISPAMSPNTETTTGSTRFTTTLTTSPAKSPNTETTPGSTRFTTILTTFPAESPNTETTTTGSTSFTTAFTTSLMRSPKPKRLSFHYRSAGYL